MKHKLWNKLNKKVDIIWNKLRNLDKIERVALVTFSLNVVAILIFIVIAITSEIIISRYLAVVIVFCMVIDIVSYLLIVRNVLRRTAIVVCGVLTILLAIFTFYINAIGNFFKDIELKKPEQLTYAVLVKHSAWWDKINLGHLGGSKIGMVKDSYADEAGQKLKEIIIARAGGDYGVSVVENENIYDLVDKFMKNYDDMQIIALSAAQLDFVSNNLDDFDDKIRVMATFNVEVPVYNIAETSVEENLNPTVIYLGVVQQFKLNEEIEDIHRISLSLRSKTPVLSGETINNKLIAINPTSHKILIVNIPVSYYAKLTGFEDIQYQLSDASIFGFQENLDTIEGMFDIDIGYYIQVYFDELELLAREVGVDMIYEQRNENKSRILDMVMNDILNTNALLRNLSPILIEAGNTFKTNVPRAIMTKLFKDQIVDGTNWQVETYDLKGEEERLSIPDPKKILIEKTVEVPNPVSIDEARQKIQSALNEE